MGRYNFTALRMRRRAVQSLENGQTRQKPVWLDILGEIPPAQVFIRRLPHKHPDMRRRIKTMTPKALPDGTVPPPTTKEVFEEVKHRKDSKMSLKPREMRFLEDELRQRFFKDHPWELARPRMVLENDGLDAGRCDWSMGILQHRNGKKLDGESVIQRQLYLIENVPDMTIDGAYDMVRREFYHARQQEDIERRVAAEEARYTGAQFGPNIIHWGMSVEDKYYDEWELWSRQQVLEKEQRKAAFAGDIASATPTEMLADGMEEGLEEADDGTERDLVAARVGER